jgi:hypothetical protein
MQETQDLEYVGEVVCDWVHAVLDKMSNLFELGLTRCQAYEWLSLSSRDKVFSIQPAEITSEAKTNVS